MLRRMVGFLAVRAAKFLPAYFRGIFLPALQALFSLQLPLRYNGCVINGRGATAWQLKADRAAWLLDLVTFYQGVNPGKLWRLFRFRDKSCYALAGYLLESFTQGEVPFSQQARSKPVVRRNRLFLDAGTFAEDPVQHYSNDRKGNSDDNDQSSADAISLLLLLVLASCVGQGSGQASL